MYGNYSTGSLSFKTAISENVDIGFIIDKPFGAKTDYPLGTGYFAQGTTANLHSTAYTALLKYRFPSNVSLIGGLRYQLLSADAYIPFLTPAPGSPRPMTSWATRPEPGGMFLAWRGSGPISRRVSR